MTVDNFMKLIEHASSAMRLSLISIQANFSDYPICTIEHIEKNVYNRSIEIRFDDLKATLTTTFSKNHNICDRAILFADQIEDIDQILLFLSDKFDYNFLKSSWLLSNCYMKIEESKEGILFSFDY